MLRKGSAIEVEKSRVKESRRDYSTGGFSDATGFVIRCELRCLLYRSQLKRREITDPQEQGSAPASEDSRRTLSVTSETERIVKWVCPLPRGEGEPRRRFHQPSRAG